MKMQRSPAHFALLLLALALALGPASSFAATAAEPAQETPPAEKKAAEAPPAKVDKPADEKKPADKADEPSVSAIADKAQEGVDQISQKVEELADKILEKAQKKSTPVEKKLHHLGQPTRQSRGYGVEVDGMGIHRRRNRDEAPPFGGHAVPASQKADEAVSVFGDSVVDGEVAGDAVAVFGDTTVNGTVTGDAVAVFGNAAINGTVSGDAVAVFGDLVLGPKAVVKGDVAAVFGHLVRDPAAQIHGEKIAIFGGAGRFGDFAWLGTYAKKCILWGRPLWIGEGLGWAWLVAGGFLLFYILIALLFPRGIERCVETIEERPGGTVLAAFLTMLLAPLLTVLLCVIVIGIPVAILLAIALFIGAVFGKAAVHAWLGRRIAKLLGAGTPPAPALAVIFGGVFITLLYLVPFLGFLLYKLFGLLGLGMVVYHLLLSMQREKPAAAAASGVGPAPVAPPVAGEGAAPTVAAPIAPPPVISSITAPRAGFWLRFAAAFLDAVLVAVVFSILSSVFHGIGGAYPLWYAVYCVVMWATKGTTIGGVICGLKVVRLDDRPVDWSVAIVRALSAFLSLAVAGLGFIWVAFDNDKQSWHDKIAGTTIVRVPKGTPLL